MLSDRQKVDSIRLAKVDRMNQPVKDVFSPSFPLDAATIDPFSPNLVRSLGTIDDAAIFLRVSAMDQSCGYNAGVIGNLTESGTVRQ